MNILVYSDEQANSFETPQQIFFKFEILEINRRFMSFKLVRQ